MRLSTASSILVPNEIVHPGIEQVRLGTELAGHSGKWLAESKLSRLQFGAVKRDFVRVQKRNRPDLASSGVVRNLIFCERSRHNNLLSDIR